MVSLAGRAQAKGLSSESRTCLIYLRVGWCKAKPWPSSVYSHCPLVSSLCMAMRPLACRRFWRRRLLPWEEHTWT